MRFFRRLICEACSPMFRHTQMMIFLKWRSSHKRGAVQHRRRVQLEMGVENTIFRPSWNDQFHILLPGHIQPWWLNHGNLPEFSPEMFSAGFCDPPPFSQKRYARAGLQGRRLWALLSVGWCGELRCPTVESQKLIEVTEMKWFIESFNLDTWINGYIIWACGYIGTKHIQIYRYSSFLCNSSPKRWHLVNSVTEIRW